MRKALLAEAALLIEADGVAALTLRELARRLGVSHAAPINHFADKDELLAELVGQGFQELAQDLASVAPGRSPEQHLRELGVAYVRFALRRRGHFRVMFGRGFSKEKSPPPTEAGGRAYDLLEEAVVAAIGQGRARSAKVRRATFLAWSVVHGAATLILDGPLVPRVVTALDDERVLEELVKHATASVAAAISGARPPSNAQKRRAARKRAL